MKNSKKISNREGTFIDTQQSNFSILLQVKISVKMVLQVKGKNLNSYLLSRAEIDLATSEMLKGGEQQVSVMVATKGRIVKKLLITRIFNPCQWFQLNNHKKDRIA